MESIATAVHHDQCAIHRLSDHQFTESDEPDLFAWIRIAWSFPDPDLPLPSLLRVSSESQNIPRRHTMAKTKTFADLTKEIDALKVKAEAVRRQEMAGVIARIKVAIEVYALTVADLGFGGGKESMPKVAPKKAAISKSSKRSIAQGKPKSKVKYRDSHGHSWTGRGPKPKWLTAALEAGQSLESLEVRVTGVDAAPVEGEAVSSQRSASTARSNAKADVKLASVAKYHDAEGNSWGGRGPKPGWVKAALAAGKNLQELAA